MFKTMQSLFTIAQAEPLDYPFADSDIAQLHRHTSAAAPGAIDEQTWHDLLLGTWARRLGREASIFGQQVLHQRLRVGLDDAACAAQAERLRALSADSEQLERLHGQCRPLRLADAEIAALLFGAEAQPALPAWSAHLDKLGPLFFASAIAGFWWNPLWIASAVALYLLMAIQMQFYERVSAWQRPLKSVQLMLQVCRDSVDDLRAPARRLGKLLAMSPMAAMPLAGDYHEWFLLGNVRRYVATVRAVYLERDFLRQCYLRCAGFEADIALARYLRHGPAVCWARRSTDGALALDGAIHPLLADALPLSLGLEHKGLFISGQNGIGKSTLLRTVGLNLLAARAFGFCHARAAQLPALRVATNMQSEDSLLGGESLYIAELRRARELLAAPAGALFLVDEIFRGTNHLESVSAAAAVLDELAARGPLIVASHNLVLASLLAHRLDPLCVRRIDGRLVLGPGVLAHTNGVALLAQHGFGMAIEGKAAQVFDWLGNYLAHPADGGPLRTEPLTI
ncbi:MAG: DNA mismatch repair protein MutS [Pseudomonadota bacterium]